MISHKKDPRGGRKGAPKNGKQSVPRAERNGKQADVFKVGPQTAKCEQLIPSPENSFIYRPRSVTDADFRRFVEGIRNEGVKAPLLVSRDAFVMSGHQRLAAATEVGLSHVPIIVLNERRSDHTQDEWVTNLLISFSHDRILGG
jgi:hypothetical protein